MRPILRRMLASNCGPSSSTSNSSATRSTASSSRPSRCRLSPVTPSLRAFCATSWRNWSASERWVSPGCRCGSGLLGMVLLHQRQDRHEFVRAELGDRRLFATGQCTAARPPAHRPWPYASPAAGPAGCRTWPGRPRSPGPGSCTWSSGRRCGSCGASRSRPWLVLLLGHAAQFGQDAGGDHQGVGALVGGAERRHRVRARRT